MQLNRVLLGFALGVRSPDAFNTTGGTPADQVCTDCLLRPRAERMLSEMRE